MQKFLKTLWEFTGIKENKDNFIQKALKVCKVFKVKPLKTPKLDAPSKETAGNLFCREIRKTNKELQGVPASKASAVILKEWKKVKTSEKKMKKYKDLYEEEKQRHEEVLQRYQEDHMDEMEIISLHKKCNKKARKVSQPKKASPKSDEPIISIIVVSSLPKRDESRKVSGPIDGPSEEEKKPKKSIGKKTATKAGKKARSHLNLLIQARSLKKKKDRLRMIKRKKIPPLLGVKEEAQSFFDLHKESKNLTIEKKEEKAVFMAGPYKGYELSYVAFGDTKYLKRVLKMSDLEKKTKDLIKQVLAKI